MISNKKVKRSQKAVIILMLLIMFTQVINIQAYAAEDVKATVRSEEDFIVTSEPVEGVIEEAIEEAEISKILATVDNNFINVKSEIEFKRELYRAMSNRQEDINIKYITSLQNAKNFESIFNKVINEVIDEDHYILYNCKRYDGSFLAYSNGEVKLTLKITYRTTKAQEDYVTKEVNKILSNIIKAGMSDRDKVKAVHDYVVLNVEYDTTLTRYTAYEGLYYGSTVCQGYALLGHKMLNQLGIPTRIFASEDMNHGWNLVKVDGKWLHMDMTWNDPVPDVKGRVLYDYFLITDQQIKTLGHTWKTSEYPKSGEGINLSLFTDVSFDHWANKQIEDLAKKNIINGYSDGSFKPGENVTRAHAAVMLVNALGLDYKGKTSKFSDVPSGHWAEGHIAAAEQAGILNGYGNGKFGPGDYITRGQISVMVSKAFNLKQVGSQKNFKDVNKDHWAYNYIEILASNGIVNGYGDNTFKPGEYASRAHFSVFLSKSLAKK